MRKLRNVLRLRFELGPSHRQIARNCDIGLGTVHDYLQRAEVAGVASTITRTNLILACLERSGFGQAFGSSHSSTDVRLYAFDGAAYLALKGS